MWSSLIRYCTLGKNKKPHVIIMKWQIMDNIPVSTNNNTVGVYNVSLYQKGSESRPASGQSIGECSLWELPLCVLTLMNEWRVKWF